MFFFITSKSNIRIIKDYKIKLLNLYAFNNLFKIIERIKNSVINCYETFYGQEIYKKIVHYY